jgi:hypothetical protein
VSADRPVIAKPRGRGRGDGGAVGPRDSGAAFDAGLALVITVDDAGLVLIGEVGDAGNASATRSPFQPCGQLVFAQPTRDDGSLGVVSSPVTSAKSQRGSACAKSEQ